MPTNRNFIFANDHIYHVFNRGIEKRPTFTNRREFIRAYETLKYYRFADLPIRLSKFLILKKEDKVRFESSLNSKNTLVEVIAFCFMPNHFHFLLRQNQDRGISKFMANFQNSYSKYFNTKHERVGPLLQGLFKAVLVEDDEQLIHLSRYIHLNPVTSYLIKVDDLNNYEWSSLPEYLDLKQGEFVAKDVVLDFFKSKEQYKKFVLDQVEYARKLETLKHLIIE